ncbi:Histone-lysine N-methyltransferase ASHR1 [Vitis vinifera]|uniref:Histone-lysine N-methyltransferase ASHR1 n=1 Tax=Vitis vinifera TaxID=29760 RepID=A0A438KMP2_VITVI|nr:Histone-lysine N-methyltransferase ASHR1 [Vitis vinifera]
MEDLQADLSANGLTVSTTPEKGRCLLSIKDFSPGEVIISQEPYVSVPNNSAVHSRCEGCFRSSNLKKCSACHVVWYCGSTCQKSDWKLHRLECNALSRLEKERQKSLTPSIRLMVKLYMRRKLQSEKVNNLLSPGPNHGVFILLWIGNALLTEDKIDLGDIITSKNNLEMIKDLQVDFISSTIKLMFIKFLFIILFYCQIMPTTARDNYNLVEALVSHITDIDEKQLVLYAQMANLVNLILQWPDINVKEIAENFSKVFPTKEMIDHILVHCSKARVLWDFVFSLFGVNWVLPFTVRSTLLDWFASFKDKKHRKLACNAHTICDGELRPLGTGLYPVISIINHSCLPNSVLVFEERLAVVRAVQHIPKGTEVLISYIETAGSTITRQKALKEQYLFTCTCPRCRRMGQYDDIQESAILEGYRCKDDRCDGFLLRDSDDIGFICQQCGLVRNKEEIKRLASKLKPLSDKATMSSSSHYVEATSIYKMIEKLQTKLFHPFSINLMRTREAILKVTHHL